MSDTLQTERTKVRRLPARGAYDRDTINAIIDEALICHVGFVVEGKAAVIPTIHWRDGERLYLHGSVASRMLRSLDRGVEACVTITLLDGLVMARSAFHHSMNYRSVVVYGIAQPVTDREEKLRALDVLVEHVCAGRTRDARPPNEQELRQTIVLSLPIDEASAKVRTGGPGDDEEDYVLPIWAGVIPLKLVAQSPISDERLTNGIPIPDYATDYRRY
jgi:nitroimidazol reductase NimA-like FMN-containing flavoprotein (pyridoxamine 5'-phosphate oxidase superfamily)